MATKIVRSNNDSPEKEPQKAVKKASPWRGRTSDDPQCGESRQR